MPKITIELDGDYPTELKNRLARYGISYGEVSRESGIDMSQISRWMNGRASPRLESIRRVEHAIEEIRAKRRKERGRGK